MNPSNKAVAVFAPMFPPAFRGGGPIRSVDALVGATPSDIRSLVLTADRDLGSSTPLPVAADTWVTRDLAEVYYSSRSPWQFWKALLAVRRKRPTLLHFNSFMNPRFTIVPLMLWRLGFWGKCAVLVAPRGEFGDGALGRRAAKKRAYIGVFRALGLHRAVIWHSTAAHESQDIFRLWGPHSRVIERENDTLLSRKARTPELMSAPLRAIFLGRIVEHKGLAIALEALQRVDGPMHLSVYGSEESAEYFARCKALASQVPAHVSVTFEGAIRPDEVVEKLAAHDVLLMPTAGENFGHVIAEALSAACIVMTTPMTPWTDVVQSGGGIIVDDRVPESWGVHIHALVSETPQRRLGRRSEAAHAYDVWASRPRKPHVWTLAWEQTTSSQSR